MLVELFGRDGLNINLVSCEQLSREIAEKFTKNGRFTKKRMRTLLLDPRRRKRTPKMLLPQPSEEESESASEKEDENKNEAGEERSVVSDRERMYKAAPEERITGPRRVATAFKAIVVRTTVTETAEMTTDIAAAGMVRAGAEVVMVVTIEETIAVRAAV